MSSPGTATCRCFSTCTPAEAASFLASIPTSIESSASPWVAYLEAVYAGPVPLPVDLKALNFFYHNDEAWRRHHPTVEWPMASCETPTEWLWPYSMLPCSQAGRNATDCDPPLGGWPQPRVPQCTHAMCRRWYRRGMREATTAKRNEHGVVVALLPARSGPPERVNSGTRTSSGVVLYGPNGGEASLPRFNHRAISSGKWAEVMRFGRPGHEGGVRESGYGFWFFAATGSGIFLNVNRTWVLRDKDTDHSLEQEYSLRMARSSLAVRDDQTRHTLRGTYPRVAAKKDWAIARQAAALAVDTVQILTSRATRFKELVAVGPMDALSAHLGACPPVALRAGWAAARECVCDPADMLINCNGGLGAPNPKEPGSRTEAQETQRKPAIVVGSDGREVNKGQPSTAGVVSLVWTDPRIVQKGAQTTLAEATGAARVLANVMSPRYPRLLFCNVETIVALGGHSRAIEVWDEVRILNISVGLYARGRDEEEAVARLLTPMRREGAMLLKLYAYLQSPFVRTLFLDTDVYVLQPHLVDSLLAHTLNLADLAAPVDPAHTKPPYDHAPALCMGLAAFRNNGATRRLFLGAVRRMGSYSMQAATDTWKKNGFVRNGDQEAIYDEWTRGDYAELRVLPLTEEYYCPQVPLNADRRSAAWSTSWMAIKHMPPYACRAVHGHSYHNQLGVPAESLLKPRPTYLDHHQGAAVAKLVGLPPAASPPFASPRSDGCKERRVLFVSAYRDIGRAAWKVRPRSAAEYAGYFEKLRKALWAAHYKLVLYIDPAKARQMALNTTGIEVVPLSEMHDSIYERYLARERRIMASTTYTARVPEEKRAKPEFSHAEYTLVNHDKIAVVHDAHRRFAGYTHIVWVDFGAIHDAAYAPRKLNLCRLPANRILASNSDPIIEPLAPLSPWEMLAQPVTWSAATGTYASRAPNNPICGGILSVPTSLVARFRAMYEAELRAWQAEGFAHFDQAMFFQLYKKTNGSLFELWSPPQSVKGGGLRCRVIFPGLLNRGRPGIQ